MLWGHFYNLDKPIVWVIITLTIAVTDSKGSFGYSLPDHTVFVN